VQDIRRCDRHICVSQPDDSRSVSRPLRCRHVRPHSTRTRRGLSYTYIIYTWRLSVNLFCYHRHLGGILCCSLAAFYSVLIRESFNKNTESHINNPAIASCAAADRAAQKSWTAEQVYASLCNSPVLPRCHWDSRYVARYDYRADSVTLEIGIRITLVTEDIKETTYLFQRSSWLPRRGMRYSSAIRRSCEHSFILNIWCPRLCGGGPNK